MLVKKSLPDGYERVKAKMPALVTVSNEVGELRYISRTKMLKTMKGSGAISTWSANDFGVAREALQKMGIAALSSPPDMGRNCQLMEGSVEDQAGKLAEIFMSLDRWKLAGHGFSVQVQALCQTTNYAECSMQWRKDCVHIVMLSFIY